MLTHIISLTLSLSVQACVCVFGAIRYLVSSGVAMDSAGRSLHCDPVMITCTHRHTTLIPFSYTQAWEELPDFQNNATLIITVNASLLLRNIPDPNTPLYYPHISMSAGVCCGWPCQKLSMCAIKSLPSVSCRLWKAINDYMQHLTEKFKGVNWPEWEVFSATQTVLSMATGNPNCVPNVALKKRKG